MAIVVAADRLKDIVASLQEAGESPRIIGEIVPRRDDSEGVHFLGKLGLAGT